MGNAGFVIATGNALVPSFVGLVLGRIEHVLPCAAFVNPQDLSPFAPFQTHKFRKMAIFLPIYCPKFVKFSKFDEISNSLIVSKLCHFLARYDETEFDNFHDLAVKFVKNKLANVG